MPVKLGAEHLLYALARTASDVITALVPCRVHDSDGNGTVSFEEFRSLHKFLVYIQQTFQQADSGRRGRLDKQTVERLLQNQGMLLMAAPLMRQGISDVSASAHCVLQPMACSAVTTDLVQGTAWMRRRSLPCSVRTTRSAMAAWT